jgi:hypothetical protein
MRILWPWTVALCCLITSCKGSVTHRPDHGTGDADASGDGPAGADEPQPPAPSVLWHVRAVAVTTSSAVIAWNSYESLSSRVDYGPTATYGTSTTTDVTLVRQHFVPITGLTPATPYHFRVASADGGGRELTAADFTFVTLSEGGSAADAYYVDVAASAGGDGLSWATAWQSFSAITWTALGPGDTLNIRGGTYDEQLRINASGDTGNLLVIKPVGPVLISRGVRIEPDHHHVRIEGLEVTNSQHSSPWGVGISIAGHDNEVVGNYVHHTGYGSGIAITGTAQVVRGNSVFFAEGIAITVSGSGNTVEDNDASRSVCFYVGDADTLRFFGDNHVIRGNFFHDVFAEDSSPGGCSPHCDCFQTYAVNPGEVAHDIAIEGNYCFDICGQMLMIEGALATNTHSDIAFRRNLFDTVGAVAINGGGVTNLIFDGNTFVSPGLGAIAINDVPGAVIQNNIFFDVPYAYGCDTCAPDHNLVYPADCLTDFAEPHGLWGVDPIFTSARLHDFRPVPGSPACTAGAGGTHLGAFPCEPLVACHDPDADGYGYVVTAPCSHVESDCDNEDPEVYPGAAEACDGKDNDCDRLRDEDCSAPAPVLELAFDGSVTDASPSALAVGWENGTASYVSGHAGQAAAFDGAGGPYVVVADDPALGGMGLFTVSVWAQKSNAQGGAVFLKHTYYRLMLGQRSITATVYTDAGAIDLNVSNYSGIDDTSWHQYSITYDSRTGTAALRVDGVEARTATGSGLIKGDPCDLRDLVVGKDPWGQAFAGAIDELVIYDNIVLP